jgi:hypothetical protein
MAQATELVLRAASSIILLPAAHFLAPLAAAEPVAPSAQATLSSSSSQASGRVAINVAAGVSNQQANSAILAHGGAALATGAIAQRLEGPGVSGGDALATIGDHALANASGLMAVNVAAGRENQLGNLAVIAIGIEAVAVTESMLAQSRASQQPNGTTVPSSPDVHVADLSATAFSGSSGLVQSNLIGGERNSSSNTFALTMLGEDPL